MSDADAFDRIEMAQEIKTLRSRLAAAEARAERLAEALREIASACECGFPRCQSNVARAALAELSDAKGKEAGR